MSNAVHEVCLNSTFIAFRLWCLFLMHPASGALYIICVPKLKKEHAALLACAVLFAVTLALYWPVRHFDFINYDDPTYVSQNRHVKTGLSWAGIEWAFTSGEESNWHPLTWLSHMTDVQLFGLKPGRHHLTNAFLHALNVVLLFLVCRRMTNAAGASFLVAGIFAWHPLRVESVAWISERKDVLSMLFFLMTLFTYLLYVESKKLPAVVPASGNPESPRKTVILYWLTLALFALGLMSKPMLVTLPFVLLLLDYWPLNRAGLSRDANPSAGGLVALWLPLFREKIPFFLLSLASCVATYCVQSHAGSVAPLTDLTLRMRVANAAVACAFYLRATLWPERLAVFYPHPYVWTGWLVFGSASLLVAISALVFWQARRRRYLLVGWLWFLGTLVPVIGLVQVGNQAYADRYTYLPLIGIAIAVVWAFKELADRSTAARAGAITLGGIILITNLAATRRQLAYWQNTATLFRHVLAVTKDNYVAHACLGKVLLEEKRLPEARQELLAALAIEPRYFFAQANMGNLLTQLGQVDEAIAALKTTIQIDPTYMLAYYHMGIALGEKGRYQEASEAYRKALSLEPTFANARYNLGLSLAKLGQPAEAETEYREAVRLDPDLAYAHYSLAQLLRASGRTAEALGHLQQAVKSDPAYLPARQELGATLLALGKLQDAVTVYEDLLHLQTNNVIAQNNLGLALVQLGRLADAIPHFAAFVRLDGSNFSARCNLAYAYLAQENYAAAATNFSEALRLKPGDTNILSKLALCESRAGTPGKAGTP